MNYADWIANLNSRGYKTTNVNGETNFQGYANALSADIQNKVKSGTNSKELQSLVASLFGNKSVMQSSQFVSALKAKGLDVKVSYQKTSYIVDEKQSGTKGQGKVRQGSIAIYEISDGKGGKLTIADANGNAAIEMEEVFLNEILTGVTSDIANGSVDGTDSKVEALKAQDAQLKAEIEKLQKEIEEETQKVQEEIDKIQKETEDKIAEATSEEEIDSILRQGNSALNAAAAKLNNMEAANELKMVVQSKMATESQLNQNQATDTTSAKMEGFKAQQMPNKNNSAVSYNDFMTQQSKNAAYTRQSANLAMASNNINGNIAKDDIQEEEKAEQKAQEQKVAEQKAAEQKEIEKKKEEEKAA